MIKTTSNIENEKSKLNKLIERNISSGEGLVNSEILEQSKLIDRLVINISEKEYEFAVSKIPEKYLTFIYYKLYNHINNITKGKVSTEDVIQNAMLSLYININHINEYGSFDDYILKMAEREALKALIEARRNAFMLRQEASEYINEIIPEDLLIEKEFRKALFTAINNLNPKFKKVIFYKYFANLTLKQISDLMDVSLSSINEWHKKAKKEIEESIQDFLIS